MDRTEKKIIRYEVTLPPVPGWLTASKMTFTPSEFKARLAVGFVVDFRRPAGSVRNGGRTVKIDLHKCDVCRIEKTVKTTKSTVDMAGINECLIDQDINNNDDTLLIN